MTGFIASNMPILGHGKPGDNHAQLLRHPYTNLHLCPFHFIVGSQSSGFFAIHGMPIRLSVLLLNELNIRLTALSAKFFGVYRVGGNDISRGSCSTEGLQIWLNDFQTRVNIITDRDGIEFMINIWKP